MKQVEKKFLKLKNQKLRRREESLKKHRTVLKNL
jgi:hypothetical protein